ncbi:MAG: SGNH/GDSL hydrolase family protein, partial [Thermoplasmata archaeon]
RIMPLGDSITYGRRTWPDPELEPDGPDSPNYVVGYRQPLYFLLQNSGYYFDFVGSLQDGELATPSFDIDHQGIPGALDSDIASNVYNYLSQNPADVVLLHIGTNSLDTNPSDVQNILNEIDRYENDNNKNIMVLLARIINRKTYSATTTQFNNNVQAMAENRIANGDEIVVVDQESALDYSTDMADNLHPNDSGYIKMANVWFNVLSEFLPVCEQFSPLIYSAPVTSAIINQTYFYDVNALGKPLPVYNLLEAPSGMIIDENTGVIQWTPDTTGSFEVTVQAINEVGSPAIQNFTINVEKIIVEKIIDNGDSGTSYTGTWSISGGTNPYGSDSLWSRDGTTYTWTFVPSISGNYELSMWWSTWPSRSDNVPVDIEYSGGSIRVYINQKQNGGKWNVIGTYPFEVGRNYKVTITSAYGSTVSTCADAVKFVYISSLGNILPTATINSITPNPAKSGEMVTFNGIGTDIDGIITGYSWRSSIDGILSNSSSFSKSDLSEGKHVIFFKVMDNNGAWSQEVSKTLEVTSQIVNPNAEHIFICLIYFSSTDKAGLISFLQSSGAYQEGDVWKYENSIQGKTYIIHIIEDIESMKQALYTDNAHIIIKGHSNYGLGGVFIDYSHREQELNSILYIDDDKIFNYSSPWVSVSVKGMIMGQAYPNWWPVFKDGTSGIMPYDFGDPRGDPPYNYYITYQVPGDKTFYKVETVRNSARVRFPDTDRPAWYSPTGLSPDPYNPDHLQYYIINTDKSFESIGKWLTFNDVQGFYGDHFCRTILKTGSEQSKWNFTINESGYYNVFAWWPATSSNSTNVIYTVNHSNGSNNISVNQTINGNQWNKLGEFYFDPGEYSVVLANGSVSGDAVADAIKITYIDNPTLYDRIIDNSYCPKTHYGGKTILFRKDLEVEPEKFKYKRMLYDACTVGSYYLDTFHRGIMFYTVASSNTYGIYRYLKAYWEGKSDNEIWQILQDFQPLYDYYNFDKLPSEQQ